MASSPSPGALLDPSGPFVPRRISGGLDPDKFSSVFSSRANPVSGCSSVLPPLDGQVLWDPLLPEDPVAHVLCNPLDVVVASSPCFDSSVADMELSLLPKSGAASPPVAGVVPSSEPVCSSLRPSLAPSLCPVRSAGPMVASGSFLSDSKLHSNFEFDCQSFPPLSSARGPSKPSPSAAAPPVSRPQVDPSPGNAKQSWASLVADDSVVLALSYHKPDIRTIDGRVRCRIPPDVAISGAAAWENTLVGFFLDKLPFSLVNAQAHRLWDAKGLSEVLCNGNGFFFFKFKDKARSLDIMNGGPWYFGGRPIFLKAWKAGMNLSKEGCFRVPIWAHFFNVPLEYWTAEGLSHIASTVGTPLHADKVTSSLKRLSYARICIEIGIDDPLPNSLDLVMEDGNLVEIRIDYSWVPKKCSSCKAFGHLPINCKKHSRQAWVPKVPPSKPCAVDNPVLQSSSGYVESASSASLDILGASGCSPRSSIIPLVEASGLGLGGSSSNAFDLLQGMEGDHIDRAQCSSGLLPVASVGGSAPPILDPSSCRGTSATTPPVGPSASTPPVRCPGAAVSPCASDPLSSPSSLSSTPLLARKLCLVDELDKKQGKLIKAKKKSRNAGNSKGKISLTPDD